MPASSSYGKGCGNGEEALCLLSLCPSAKFGLNIVLNTGEAFMITSDDTSSSLVPLTTSSTSPPGAISVRSIL